MVDANCGFSVPGARRFAARVRDVDLAWLEEPIAKGDYAAQADLGAQVDVPIATGENLYSAEQFGQVLANDAADVLQPDVARVGGVTPWMRVADMAAARNVAVSPHYVEPIHVHLAAVGPLAYAPTRVYSNNTLASYHALVAADEAGATVVWTSSEAAYGWVFADGTPLPDALPVTVDHPCRPEDQYGTSKVAGEATAAMVARRYDVPVTTIRPSWIQHPGAYDCTGDDGTDLVDNFWSYVDVRDVTRLVRAALETPPDGHATVHAVADENYAGRLTRELFREAYGTVPSPCDLTGDASALANDRARELFDWAPRHSCRTSADDDVGPADDWQATTGAPVPVVLPPETGTGTETTAGSEARPSPIRVPGPRAPTPPLAERSPVVGAWIRRRRRSDRPGRGSGFRFARPVGDVTWRPGTACIAREPPDGLPVLGSARPWRADRSRATAWGSGKPLSSGTVSRHASMSVTLKDFHAEWCGPCKTQDPILEEIKDDWGDRFELQRVDVDEEQDVANQYQVRSLPTLIVENDDGVVERFIGVTQREDIEAALESAGA